MYIRKAIVWIMCVLILLGFTGCSAARENFSGNGMSSDYITKEEGSLHVETSTALPENRKLIQTVNMQIETENLDTVLQQINGRLAELNGYVEHSNIQNGSAYQGERYRSATMTLRVPAEDLDSFVNRVGEISNIVSSQKNVDDVTLSYVANESRKKALEAEEARLLQLMEKAATLNDLLTVEKRLTEVQTELEKVISALRVYDNQVDYATIRLSIEEVKEFTDVSEPENIWDRIGNGLQKSLKSVGNFFVELFVLIAVSLPYIGLFAVSVFIIWRILRFRKHRKNRKGRRDAGNAAP